MPLETDLSPGPYHVSFNPNDNYHMELFRPGVSVQVRELNDLQLILQNQIERFGDNIIRRGSIVDGCNFTFLNNYPYVKLEDETIDGTIVIPSEYKGLFAKNSSNVRAYITNYYDGFETSSPDLKTLYIHYTNSGDDAQTTKFSPADTLTVYDSNNSIFKVSVENGGIGFANSDTVVFTPAIVVSNTGAFTNTEYLIQPSTNATLQIVGIDTATLSSDGYVILSLRPKTTDLSNSSANSLWWTFDQGEELKNVGNTTTAVVEKILGSDAAAFPTTSGTGRVIAINISARGQGFSTLPHVSLWSNGNASGLATLDLTPQNYYSKVKIAGDAESVGNGYAFSLSEGIIYQKGFFVRVAPQLTIVEKYSNQPNNVVVGFQTNEDIVDSNEDPNLLDNAIGTKNENAPGANRLKLTPVLVVLPTDDAASNTEFFDLVSWNDGKPFKQNQITSYSRIGDEMAARMFDQSGNFVVDTFQVATDHIANASLDALKYNIKIDPGQAYIMGRKVQTLSNYSIDIDKGLNTRTSNNIVSVNYGSYVRIKEVGGLFQFSTADTVDLYSAAKGFLSNTALVRSGNTSPVGTKIGEARMRMMTHENGLAGAANTSHRLYLFNIKMSTGQNFRSVRSVYYNGSQKGIADVILDADPTTGTNVAILEGTNDDKLIFSAGCESLKNSSNTNYTYRTIDQTLAIANTGLMTKSIAGNPNEFFPYTGALSDSQLQALYVAPTGNTLYQYEYLTGTASVNTTVTTMTGTTTNFFSDFEVGDYVHLYSNALNQAVHRIVSIANTTTLTLDSNVAFTNTAVTFRRAFPQYVPIPFGSRTGLSANVDANSNILTLSFHHANGLALTFEGSVTVNTALGVDIERRNVSSASKTAVRDRFVKIRPANNAGGLQGPWCLGVPDIFRMRNVYLAQTSTVNTASVSVVHDFYIDHNQTSNFHDLGWLFLNPRSGIVLTSNDYLLVEFDYFTRGAAGYFDAVSYRNTANAEQIAVTDALPLANLTTAASSWEIPEVYTYNGQYYDLMGQLDFRPAVSNTVAPTANASAAPLNPLNTTSFGNTADPANDKKFPLPDSTVHTNVEQYLGRIDSVFISGGSGDIYVLKGISDADPRKRYEANHPKDSLKLQTITVPPYPNITQLLGEDTQFIISTGVANEKAAGTRMKVRTIRPLMTNYENQLSQPMVYTNEDVGNLERRISDLEYYQSLSILETSITNRVIPSSVDRTQNRFKYGFFADDFSTDTYSDLANPQYKACIELEGDQTWGATKNPLEPDNFATADNVDPTSTILSPTKLVQRKTNRCVPPKLQFSIDNYVENVDWIDELLVEQPLATVTAPPGVCLPNGAVTSSQSNVVTESYVYDTRLFSTDRYHFTYFVAANTSGTITIYVYASGGGEYQVYQNGTLKLNTINANTVSALSAADKTFLSQNAAAATFRQGIDLTKDYVRKVSSTSGHSLVKGIAKITIPHNPSSGLSYSMMSGSGLSDPWRALVRYPAYAYVNDTVDPCGTSQVPQYRGTINFSGIHSWSCSKSFNVEGKAFSGNPVVIHVTGLKPLTVHKYYRNGVELTSDTQMLSPNDKLAVTKFGSMARGTPLITDAEGKLNFFINQKPSRIGQSVIGAGSEFDYVRTVVGSSGYTLLELKTENSAARILAAARDAFAVIAYVPTAAP